MENITYMSIGNDELESQPECKEGDIILCHNCGKVHIIKAAKAIPADESDISSLLYFGCDKNKKTYIAGVNGKLLPGVKKMEKKKIIGYKVFNKDWRCRGFKYEVGKSYKHDGVLELYESGFHFCLDIIDCFKYYLFTPENKVAKVEARGKVIYSKNDDSKCVTDDLFIIEEIPWDEVLKKCNIGKGNTGFKNIGNYNVGFRNSGRGNDGNDNSGSGNQGFDNAGNGNQGCRNAGNDNQGSDNSGNGNQGWRNSGRGNDGNDNSGSGNQGWGNAGNKNVGSDNVGNVNFGSKNVGDYNFGDKNAGFGNVGNGNIGNFNSSNFSIGAFNSTQPETIRIFNKEIKMDMEELLAHEGMQVCLRFIPEFPKDYKRSWRLFLSELTPKEKASIKEIPGFDLNVFFEITGQKI